MILWPLFRQGPAPLACRERLSKDICGHPMLWHQIHRAKLARSLDKLVVATTELPRRIDRQITAVAQDAGVDSVCDRER